MVGLGDMIQLAMAAMLMVLWGDDPILNIVPKPLLWQWQEKMDELLGMPSVGWDVKQWLNEYGICHGSSGPDRILKMASTGAVGFIGKFQRQHRRSGSLEAVGLRARDR